MKRLFFVIISLFLFNNVYAQNTDPVVTNVHAQQRAGTKLIDITYDLSDADGDTMTITVQVSNDSGQTYFIIPVSLTGDVASGITSGTGKSIVWDAGTDYPGQNSMNFQVKVIANDNKGISCDFVLVPEGEFKMGDNFNDDDLDEKPVHKVYLDEYYIGKYEVTNGEYIEFLRDVYSKGDITVSGNDVKLKDGNYCYELNYSEKTINYSSGSFTINESYKNHPVVCVSWSGAVAYCNWLGDKEMLERCYDAEHNLDITKKGYRLPTEAEWEKAARGDSTLNDSLGHQRRYPWGDNIYGSYANFWYGEDPYESGSYPYTTPVGYYNGSIHNSFATNNNASPYGAFDMAGNVWEWCSDWYGRNYYQYCVNKKVKNNPSGPESGSYRVVRSGSWYTYPYYLRAANRNYYYPPYTNNYLGFRCLREVYSTDVPVNIETNEINIITDQFTLEQNYPNPFNPETIIEYQLPKASKVKLRIFNILGQKVKTLIDEEKHSGYHSVKWDGTNNYGQKVASGIYLYRLQTESFTEVKKMILLK